jgi:hypothetical protein
VETLFTDGSKKEFAYDQLGNLTKAVNSTVEERYHYDECSRSGVNGSGKKNSPMTPMGM